nr:hypothetical protein [Tanacetum cinerariifolium]
DRALSLIGPYGAGKSAFAAFLARLVSEPTFRKRAKVPADVPAAPQLLPVPIVGSRTAIGPALLTALRHTLDAAPAGKFLEYAATHPHSADIFVLQELAEAAARAPQESALWVLTILHQNAEAYAHRLGRTQQGEWAKVAQRFRQLPLFPSDVERMDLIGRALLHDP